MSRITVQAPPAKLAFEIGTFVRQKYSSIRESLGIPVKQVDNNTWIDLEAALRALHESPGLFPPLRSAVSILTSCLDVLEAISKNRREYEELASELTRLSQLLIQHTTGARSIRMSIEEQAKHIRKKCDRGEGRRFLEARDDEEALYKSYRRIEVLFRQLQTDATLSALSLAEEQMANTRLEGLTPAKLANYNSKLSTEISRRTCTEDTRTEVLSGLDDWSYDLEGADLYWMNGMAGTGKTTIACSFSERLEERKQLAASFFCTRTSAECRDVTRIVPTIAYQFARYSIPFRSVLCEVLGGDPDISSKKVQTQFERLLKEPLVKVKGAIPSNLVVVIDALDECDDKTGTKLVLDMLFQSAVDLPLKFFVTSRPEPEISKRMLSESPSTRSVMYLHDIEESVVQADIMRYLREELASISPTPTEIKQLVQRSGKLFIYAATLVRYIRPSIDPRERLESVLAMTSHSTLMHTEIDKLYKAILTEVFDTEAYEAMEIKHIKLALYTVLCVQEPLGIHVLSELIGLEKTRMLSVLSPVESVIQFSDDGGVVSTFHASFPDFMFDKSRSGAFHCDVSDHNSILAGRCLKIMKAQLRFNICNLESSFFADAEVEDLEERMNKFISPVLFYSCRYWGHHLRLSPYSDSLCTVVKELISVQLLFWMEVVNLKKAMSAGLETFFKAGYWSRGSTQAGGAPPEVQSLIQDARDFITSFAHNSVSQSSPHIYISSIPFCQRSNSVYKLYHKNLQRTMNATGGLMQSREAAALATWEIDPYLSVYSVACSPDGGLVAVGGSDNHVRVYNAHDGALLVGPLQGHSEYVWSVTFSPDGRRVASSSGDATVRIWDSHDGTPVADSLETGSPPACSVAYSPDGTQIASVANNSSICIRNARDGSLIADPFESDTGQIWALAYSPDGTRIASGSQNGSIRVWSVRDRTPTDASFNGHTNIVCSVVYSPNCRHIASGSHDGTIRVWDAHNGAPVLEPIDLSVGSVNSVAYSPDGTRIASGSSDGNVQVWSAQDGTLLAGPFKGSTANVMSVAYSPDATRIFSGSSDGTVRVWSAHGPTATRSPQVYTGIISSVAYTPNGTRIVSSCADKLSYLWSAENGDMLLGPIRGAGYSEMSGSMPVSPDSRHIISLDESRTGFQVMDIQDTTLTIGPFEGHTGEITSAIFSPDGKHIISSSQDATIRVWDASTGSLIESPLEGHKGPVLSIACSPDGKRIVSRSDDNVIRVWITPTTDEGQGNEEATDPEVPSDVPKIPSLLYGWHVRDDGWVMDTSQSRRLFWAPKEIIGMLSNPNTAFVISPDGSLQIDFRGMLIGERWHECHVPN